MTSTPAKRARSKKLLPSSHFGLGWEMFVFYNNPTLHDTIVHADLDKFSVSRGMISSGNFYAHKEILAARCNFLRNVLYYNGEENKIVELSAQEGEVQVSLRLAKDASAVDAMSLDDDDYDDAKSDSKLHVYLNASSDAVDLVLRYLYKGSFDVNSVLPAHSNGVDSTKYFKYIQTELLPQVMALCNLFELKGLLEFLRKRIGMDPGKISYTMTEKIHVSHEFLSNCGSLCIRVGDVEFRNQSAVFLAARSSFFASILNGLWTESSSDLVQLELVPVEPMRKILQFVNCIDDLGLAGLQDVLEVLQWAFYFGVNSLVDYCEHILDVEHLNEATVCPIWNLVSSHAETEYLAQKCEAFVQQNFLQCARNQQFLCLRQDLLKGILDAGKINAESLDMMNAIRRWAEARAENPSHAKDLFFQMMPPHTMFNTYNRMILLGVVDNAAMTGIPRSMLFQVR